MLQTVKLALRITTDAFDSELNRLIAECIEEMTGLGITIETEEGAPTSDQVKGAVVKKLTHPPVGSRGRHASCPAAERKEMIAGQCKVNFIVRDPVLPGRQTRQHRCVHSPGKGGQFPPEAVFGTLLIIDQ